MFPVNYTSLIARPGCEWARVFHQGMEVSPVRRAAADDLRRRVRPCAVTPACLPGSVLCAFAPVSPSLAVAVGGALGVGAMGGPTRRVTQSEWAEGVCGSRRHRRREREWRRAVAA